MANFDTDRFGPEKMSSSFKTITNALCPRCNDYGKISLPVYLDLQDGTPKKFVCWKVICYLCKGENGKHGSLYTFYTGTHSKPNFNTSYIKLPLGLSMEIIRITSEEEPTKQVFTIGELLESRKKMF